MVEVLTENEIKHIAQEFQCQRCGKCCIEGIGVALLPNEVRKLKGIIPFVPGMSWSKFRDFTFTLNNHRLLKLPCALYDREAGECRIYKDRPLACRLFPFRGIDNSVSNNCPEVKRIQGGT